MKHHTRIYDIDGTLVEYGSDPDNNVYVLNIKHEVVSELKKQYESGDHIIIWTSRREEFRSITEEHLKLLEIPYHILLMDKNFKITVYDDKAVQLDYKQIKG